MENDMKIASTVQVVSPAPTSWRERLANALAPRYRSASRGMTLIEIMVVMAIIGIITSFICGYITGWLFAMVWNWFAPTPTLQ